MRWLVFAQLRPEKGVPYSDRQLRRLEAKGLFPKRQPFAEGGALKGWPEIVIDAHLWKIAEKSEPTDD